MHFLAFIIQQSDLLASQRWLDEGNGRGWKSWRFQLQPEVWHKARREVLISPSWKQIKNEKNKDLFKKKKRNFHEFNAYSTDWPTCEYGSKWMTPVTTQQPTKLLLSPLHVQMDSLRDRHQFRRPATSYVCRIFLSQLLTWSGFTSGGKLMNFGLVGFII